MTKNDELVTIARNICTEHPSFVEPIHILLREYFKNSDNENCGYCWACMGIGILIDEDGKIIPCDFEHAKHLSCTLKYTLK